MTTQFIEACKKLLDAEGGLLIDPGEGGGAAFRGITLTTFRAHRKDDSLTVDDLKLMTDDEAIQIYYERYYLKCRLDLVQGQLTLDALLDQAANRGVNGLFVDLIETLSTRYKVELPPLPTWEILMAEVYKIPDRKFFRRFVCDAQHRYRRIALKKMENEMAAFTAGYRNLPPDMVDAETQAIIARFEKRLRMWTVRTHNLLKLLE